MLELANTILDITGSKSKIIHQPLPLDDPKQRQPDISLAKEELNNWEPKIQLREGLEKTINYFDNLLKNQQ
jgi:UDP-glucuronate decarboxylase